MMMTQFTEIGRYKVLKRIAAAMAIERSLFVLLVVLPVTGCGTDPVTVTVQNASLEVCSGVYSSFSSAARTNVDVHGGDGSEPTIAGLPANVKAEFYYKGDDVERRRFIWSLEVHAPRDAPPARAHVATIHADAASTTIAITVTGACL